MGRNNITARGFYTDAENLFKISREIENYLLLDDNLIRCFLWGRTIELVLKSFLLANGRTADSLKRLGHDLDKLLDEAEKQNVFSLIGRMTYQRDRAIVHEINIDYSSKRYEYRESGAIYIIPDSDLTIQLINRLLKGINYCITLKEPGLIRK